MTDMITLSTIEQFTEGYTPIYPPIYPLLLQGKTQKYAETVGQVNFTKMDVVGDVRAKHITPKDTILEQIAAAEGKKGFKKYFLGNQFIQSDYQDARDVDSVTGQVLDEHNKQFDELLLLGEGTSASTMVNNSLFWSNDPNYTLEDPAAISAGTDPLIDFQAKLMASVVKADLLSGRKLLMFYGTDAVARFNSMYVTQPVPYKRVLRDILGNNYSEAVVPAEITPAGVNGWMILNMDQIKTHYVTVPKIKGRGINEEKSYAWTNFVMGSAMIEVLAKNAIVRQPVTF